MGIGRKITVAVAAGVTAVALAASPVWACGGLVNENGTVTLVRTTTLAAWADGVQRYVTAFSFEGDENAAEVGSIIPLPGVPTDVERAGDWTLQRLVQEVAPPASEGEALATADAAGGGSAEVILETEVDALDITVLRGDAQEVGRWALDNGFFLTPDAPEVLDYYAARSDIFLAAKFDASRAASLGQGSGDATPIMVTIPTDRPWVPLRILGLGAGPGDVIEADVFLLTPDQPRLLAGGRGLGLERNEEASEFLLDDLRSDVGMEWLPDDMWLTYLPLEADAAELDYDLAVSVDADVAPTLADAGVGSVRAAVPIGDAGDSLRWWPLAAGGVATVAVLGWFVRRSRVTEVGPA